MATAFGPWTSTILIPATPIPSVRSTYKSDIGSSTYNALGLALERRFSQGTCLSNRDIPGLTPSMTDQWEAASRMVRKT